MANLGINYLFSGNVWNILNRDVPEFILSWLRLQIYFYHTYLNV